MSHQYSRVDRDASAWQLHGEQLLHLLSDEAKERCVPASAFKRLLAFSLPPAVHPTLYI